MTFRFLGATGLITLLSATAAVGCSDDGGSSDDAMGGNFSGGTSAGGTSAAGTSTGGTAGAGMATGGTAGAGMATGGTAGAGMGEAVTFTNDVYPIMIANCNGIGCHGDDSFLPQHANSDVSLAYDEAQDTAQRIANRVSGVETPIMPQNCGSAPGDGTCLSLEEVAVIREWVEQGAVE